MKISLNWAQWYSKVDLKANSTQELVQLATERLGGVEGSVDYTERYNNIYVVKVISVVKHPNADKLRVCKVDDGGVAKNVKRDENGYVQIVCGAPEVKEGWLVGWLAPGASVPGLYDQEVFILEAKELRGEVSYGMMGTAKELGVSGDESGLLVINPEEFQEEVKPGISFASLLGLDDVIVEVENKMFTHRPDCFGILGVARELAGIQHISFTSPDWYLQKPEFKSVSGLSATLQNEAGELAPRVMMVPLSGIKVGPSPLWMQSYLTRVGIRPINNIVDITNYVMYLTAQPMHAFDYDKLAAHSKDGVVLGPRMAEEGEKITLLGGKEVALTKEDIVLATDKVAVDIAGVMGGAETEVDEGTKNVLLTCCAFDMYAVRRMTMRHGIFTDAATRNTKGQPPAQIDRVLAYAMQLMNEHANAKQSGEVQDDYNKPVEQSYIEVTSKFINDRLGSKFTNEQIIKMLTNVEFEAHVASGPISVTPPFWRTDIEIAEDIVEEVGRLYGFNRLPLMLPKRDITPVLPSPELELKQQIRETLSRAGANELLTYSFVHGNLLQKVGQDPKHAYKLRNALSPDLQYYRLSITPNLLDKVHSNIKEGFDKFALFELGKVHYKGEMDAEEPEVPNEDSQLAFVVAYADKAKPSGAPYFQARKYFEQVAPELIDSLVPASEFDFSSDEWGRQFVAPYEIQRSALIVRDGQIWGVIGEYKYSARRAFKLPEYSAGFEVHLDVLKKSNMTYQPLSRYPSTEQDLTLKVAAKLPYAQLKNLLESELGKTGYQWSLRPLSIFQEENSKTKNISFRITLTHFERTLTTKEANELVEKLAVKAKSELKAERV